MVGLDLRSAPEDTAADAWIQQDMRDTAGLERVLGESPSLSGLDHVVTVAGGALADEIGRLDPADVPVELFTATVQLNLIAQYAVVRAGAARIEAETPAGDRSITLISSINALRGYGMPGYSSAKAGLLGLVVATALPLGRRGLRINAVVPGTVVPEAPDEQPVGTPEPLGPRLIDASASRQETRPEDVARAIVAVVGLRQMTGQYLIVDGGQLATPFDRYPLD